MRRKTASVSGRSQRWLCGAKKRRAIQRERVPARNTCTVVCTEVGPRALADAPRPSFLVPPPRPAKPQAPCHKRALGRGSLKSNPFGYVLDPIA